MKTTGQQNKQWFLYGSIILVIIIGLIVATRKSGMPLIPMPKQALRRSIAPGIITKAVTAKSIDPTTGEALNPTTSFASTDKNIFLVLSLKNPKVGAKFEYVRYLNAMYLDKGSVVVTKPETNNVSFVWTLKKVGAVHPIGQYRVKVYTNGIFEKETSFVVF